MTEMGRSWNQLVLTISGFCGLCGVVVLMAVLDPAARPNESPSASASSSGLLPGPDGLPNYIHDPDAAVEHVTRLVQRSGGDFERLSAAEKRWLDSMSAGRGREMLYARAIRMFPDLALPEPPELAARRQALGGSADSRRERPSSPERGRDRD